MHAHFERHIYHRHSHETYSFGVTEEGAQSFTCRESAHTSAAGMVMAFNPDDPHDGHASDELGFTYRMVHIGPELVSDVLAGSAGRPARLPLFTDPVVSDPVLAGHVRPEPSTAGRRARAAPRRTAHRDDLLDRGAGSRAGGPTGPARGTGRIRRADQKYPAGQRGNRRRARPRGDPRRLPRRDHGR
jgi:hypothetical protein